MSAPMTDRISVGDLVQVVRPTPCCNNTAAVGRRIFKIVETPSLTSGHCSHCFAATGNVIAAFNPDNGQHYQLSRLKRIPPLDELEGVKTDEPMKEPA